MPADAPQVPPLRPVRGRRWRRFAGATVGLLVLGHGVAVLAGWPVAWPFDVVVNLGDIEPIETLRVPADGLRRVVVLQHGLWRTPASLGRLARALAVHGYEVHSPGYPSTTAPIEAHAERLRAAVEAIYASGPVAELAFVGHSMGGLVVEQYLRLPDARTPVACVYLGTPHRGAMLADLRKHWFLFRWAMGSTAALQLSPGHAFHRQPIPTPAPAGTVVGDLGEGNPSIPGHDDQTVGVAEATFAGAADVVTLPVGHTRITTDPESIRQVLHFLRHRAFARTAAAR